MDGAGFKVKLHGRSLAFGECRIKRETVRIVFGEDLVPLEGVNEVILTLTDAADNSRWQASLKACDHDNKYCWISGLRGWMQNKRATANDRLHINREAQGALYLRLDPGAASYITHVPSSSHERTAEAHGATGSGQHASVLPPPTNYITAEDYGRPSGVVAASDTGGPAGVGGASGGDDPAEAGAAMQKLEKELAQLKKQNAELQQGLAGSGAVSPRGVQQQLANRGRRDQADVDGVAGSPSSSAADGNIDMQDVQRALAAASQWDASNVREEDLFMLRRTCTDLSLNVEALQRQRQELQRQLDKAASDKSELHNSLQQQRQRCAALEEERRNADDRLQRAQAALSQPAALEEQLAQLREQLAEREREARAAKARCSDLEHRLEASMSECQRAQRYTEVLHRGLAGAAGALVAGESLEDLLRRVASEFLLDADAVHLTASALAPAGDSYGYGGSGRMRGRGITEHEQGHSRGATVRSQSRSPSPRRGMCLSSTVGTPASRSGGLLQPHAPAAMPTGQPQPSADVGAGAELGGYRDAQPGGAGADQERNCEPGNSDLDGGAVGERGAQRGEEPAELAAAGPQTAGGVVGCEEKADARDTSAVAVPCAASTAPVPAPAGVQQEDGSGGSSAKEEVNTRAVAMEQGQEVDMGSLAGDASRPPLCSHPPSALSPPPHPGPLPLSSLQQQDRPAFKCKGPTSLPLTVLLPFAPAWMRLLPDNRSKEPMEEVAAVVAEACITHPVCGGSAASTVASVPFSKRLAKALATVLGLAKKTKKRLARRLVLLGPAAVLAVERLAGRGWVLDRRKGSVLRLALWPGTGPEEAQEPEDRTDSTAKRRRRPRWTAGGTRPPATAVPGLKLRVTRPPSKSAGRRGPARFETEARFKEWHTLGVAVDFTDLLAVLRTGSEEDLSVIRTWTEQLLCDNASYVFLVETEPQGRAQQQKLGEPSRGLLPQQQHQSEGQGAGGGDAMEEEQQQQQQEQQHQQQRPEGQGGGGGDATGEEQQQQPGDPGVGSSEQQGGKHVQHQGHRGDRAGGPAATVQPVHPLQLLQCVPLHPAGFMIRCSCLQGHLPSSTGAEEVGEVAGKAVPGDGGLGAHNTAALEAEMEQQQQQQQQPAPKRAKRGQGQPEKQQKVHKRHQHPEDEQHHEQEQPQQLGGAERAGGQGVPPCGGEADVLPDAIQRGRAKKRPRQEQKQEPLPQSPRQLQQVEEQQGQEGQQGQEQHEQQKQRQQQGQEEQQRQELRQQEEQRQQQRQEGQQRQEQQQQEEREQRPAGQQQQEGHQQWQQRLGHMLCPVAMQQRTVQGAAQAGHPTMSIAHSPTAPHAFGHRLPAGYGSQDARPMPQQAHAAGPAAYWRRSIPPPGARRAWW